MYSYAVHRMDIGQPVTTTRLADVLNKFAADGAEIFLPVYIGGRDWVIITRRRWEDA